MTIVNVAASCLLVCLFMGPRSSTEATASVLEAADAVGAIIKRIDRHKDTKLALPTDVINALSDETTVLTSLLKDVFAVLADQYSPVRAEKDGTCISELVNRTEELLLLLFPILEKYENVSQREVGNTWTTVLGWPTDRKVIEDTQLHLRKSNLDLCYLLSLASSPNTSTEVVMARPAMLKIYEESVSSVGNTRYHSARSTMSEYHSARSTLSGLSIESRPRRPDDFFNEFCLEFCMTDEFGSSSRPAYRDSCRKQTKHTKNEEYTRLLVEKSLILGPEQELNWSGRGQHVEFEPPDEPPLTVLGPLGASMQARIDKVRCRRIVLARKTMKTNRKWTLEHAINEVGHLNGLRHAHIVQLVGSYLMHKDFAILLYPAADCNLTDFMTHWSLGPSAHKRTLTEESIDRKKSLVKFFSCLAHALHFVHTKVTRHADIKPANILVKFGEGQWWQKYHLYLADFGISKSFVTQDQSQTESTEGRTLRYCAPEVYNDEPHGRASDIFSLGCVYSEMITVLAGKDLDDFSDFRRLKSENDHYHAHIEQTKVWLGQDVELALIFQIPVRNSPFQTADAVDLQMVPPEWIETFKLMLAREPRLRPTALVLTFKFEALPCCDTGPEAYVADPSLKD